MKRIILTAIISIIIGGLQICNGQTFTNSTSMAIPDNNTTGIYSNIVVSGVFSMANLTSVTINITHTYDADLDIYLVDPYGSIYELSTDNGGSGDNYTNTVFSNSAVTNITSGSAPFTGSYKPEQQLPVGLEPNGTWRLNVIDDAGSDVGTLNSWSITFTAPACPTVGIHYEISSIKYNFPASFPCTNTNWIFIRANDFATAGGTLTPAISVYVHPTNAQTTGNNIHGFEQHGGTWYNYWSDVNMPANTNRTFTMFEVDNSTSTMLGVELCDVRTGADMPYIMREMTCGETLSSGTWVANDGVNTGAAGPSANPPGTGCQFITFPPTSVKGFSTYNCPTCPVAAFDDEYESFGWAYFNPSIAGPGTYNITFNYNNTCSAPNNCTGSTTVQITVTSVNSISLSSPAGTDNQTRCINQAITNISYSTTGATGASVSGLPTGVSGSWSGNVFTITGTPSQSGTFNYTVTSSGGCPTVTATGTITVNPNNTITLSSGAGTNNQSVCVNSTMSNITFNTTGATGATVTGLPTGVNGSWSGNVVTISGTPTTTGSFPYTVTLTGGCGSVTYSGTITVNPNNTITLSSGAGTNNQTLCISTSMSNITFNTTGATGANVTGLPTGVNGSWSGNVVTINGVPTTSGSYPYTVTLTGGCGSVTATGTITVTPNNTITLSSGAGSNNQSVCVNVAMSNITFNTTGATGATVTGLPSGTSGSWASNVVTISGIPTATGLFPYTVSLTGGCGTITTTGTITVNPNNTITLTSGAGSNNQTLCINSSMTNITFGTTGATGANVTGLPSGVSGVWNSNTVTISGIPSASGSFNYTVTLTGGCGTISSTGTITVNPVNTITLTSANNSQTVCLNSAITNITYNTTGATSATFAGLPAGVSGTWSGNVVTITGSPSSTIGSPFNFTVNLTGGCGTVSASGTITVNPLPSITSATSTNVTVCSGSDGTITVNATGFAPLEYSITGGSPYFNNGGLFTGLPNGVYPVVVSNGYGCTSSYGNVSISDGGAPPAPTAGTNATYCEGAVMANLTATASAGGTLTWYSNPALTTILGTGTTLAPLSNTGVSNYYVTENVAGCVSAASQVTVTINPTVVINAFSPSSTSRCQGAGTITVTTTAVNSLGLTYDLDASSLTGGNTINPSTGEITFSAGWSGTTTVTASATGCNGPVTTNYVITVNPLPVASSTSTGILCNGTTANVIVSAIGGTSPYSGTGTFPEYAGTYNYTITDNEGCTASTSISLSEPDELIASSTSTEILCNGGTSAVTVSAIGGTTPYTNTGTYNETAGPYNYTVTDANGCTSVTGVIISEPEPISTSVSSTFAGCGLSDGSATVTATGGTGTLIYNWSPTGGNSSTATGLVSGSYTVVTQDDNGCSVTDNIDVINSSSPTSNTTHTDVLCFGLSTGTIDLTVNGGTGSYTYDWNSGVYTTEDITGLPAGTYSYTVTDAANCQTTGSVVIDEPAELLTSITVSTNPLCFGNNNGISVVLATGGTTPYTYLWSDISSTNNDTILNLEAGIIYYVTVSDNNGCTSVESVTLTSPNQLVVNETITEATCTGSDGTIELAVTGGTGTITYEWSNTLTTPIITGLPSGNYTVTITDANGCSVIETYTITNINAGQIQLASVSDVLCYGESNGSVTVSMTGGTADFTFVWSTGDTVITSSSLNTLSNLTIGTYYVTVMDFNGCESDTMAIVSGPGSAVSTTITVHNISCNGLSDGILIANVTGGISPYYYNWSNSQTGATNLNLSEGTYSVTISDNNGCTFEENNIIITEPEPLTVISIAIPPVCAGDTTASGSVIVTGGVEPYEYAWSNQMTTETITGITAGTYIVTVTDINGCKSINILIITQPTPIVVTYEQGTDVATHAGYIDLTVSGGGLPYNYIWSNTAVSQDIYNLTGGWYTYTITDANTCQITDSILVELALGIPNTITPNNDGKNDDFFIINIEAYQKVDINIFSRWNDLLYTFSGSGTEYNQTGTRFNGTYNGAKLPMGSYLYIVVIDDEEKISGSLLIKY